MRGGRDRDRPSRAGGRPGPLHRRSNRLGRGQRVRGQPRHRRAPQARRPHRPPRQLQHNYPHCWRTDTPIIYKAITSWYVEVTAIRDRLCELNQQINWIPDHVRDGRFGMWLEGARDWSISRNRFWGSPHPGVAQRRPGPPPHRRLRLPGRDRARLRGPPHRPAPTPRGRAGAAQPRRPHRPVDDAAGSRGARLLVRVRVHALRPGPLPVRARRMVREPLPGRLHRRVHQPDPGLVLHPARAGRGPCSTSPPSRT